MQIRDVAAYAVLLSAVEAYLLIQVAPQLRPTGGVGRLGFRMFLLNLTLYTVWSVLVYPFCFSPLRHIPGPRKGNLILGHAVQARISKPRGEYPRQWMEEIPNDGLLRIRDAFNADAVIPTSHAMLKTVLNDNSYDYEKQPRVVDILRTILGDGLILVEGSEHKFQRKHLLPSFQTKVIHALYPTFWDKACEMADMLRTHVHEPEIEMSIWSTRATLDIIGIAGFGRDFNALKNPSDQFVADFQDVLEPHGEKVFFFALNLLFPHWLVSKIPFWRIPRELNRISTSLYQFGYSLSRQRRAELSNSVKTLSEKDRYNDILSHLVISNDFTDHELAHQFLTMLAAGHETTSSTLSWALFLLATHPSMQIDLRNEIRSTLPSPITTTGALPITSSQIEALPLLSAVCAETLRLYPTVPITTRQSVRPTQLGPYTLPVGTTVYIIPWATNRLTSLWGPAANTFTPARWLDTSAAGIQSFNKHGGAKSNYSNLTFLHGPRSCIGQGFARSELKCLLAVLVGRFEFGVTRDLGEYYPAGIVTTKPAKGMWLSCKEVEGW